MAGVGGPWKKTKIILTQQGARLLGYIGGGSSNQAQLLLPRILGSLTAPLLVITHLIMALLSREQKGDRTDNIFTPTLTTGVCGCFSMGVTNVAGLVRSRRGL